MSATRLDAPRRRAIAATALVGCLCLVLAPTASAGYRPARARRLQACLADFDGLDMRLPYMPQIHITACRDKPSGERELELIGDGVVAPADNTLDHAHSHAALEAAVLAWFEPIFRKRG